MEACMPGKYVKYQIIPTRTTRTTGREPQRRGPRGLRTLLTVTASVQIQTLDVALSRSGRALHLDDEVCPKARHQPVGPVAPRIADDARVAHPVVADTVDVAVNPEAYLIGH
jgi:hypothetical protein